MNEYQRLHTTHLFKPDSLNGGPGTLVGNVLKVLLAVLQHLDLLVLNLLLLALTEII